MSAIEIGSELHDVLRGVRAFAGSGFDCTTAQYDLTADVIGIDVVGFSRFTESLIERKGAGAAEDVSNILQAGFEAVGERLAQDGFLIVDSLGDGVVLARPARGASRTDDDRLVGLARNAEQYFEAATGSLTIRAALAHGALCLCRVGGWRGEWDLLATGPAIEALHAALQRRRHMDIDPFPARDARSPHAENVEATDEHVPKTIRPSGYHADGNGRLGSPMRSIAEIRKLAVAFVALGRFDDLPGGSLTALQEVALSTQRLAQAWGGRLEKISHDDKGLLLDLCFSRTRRVGESPLHSALDCLFELQPILRRRGFTPRFGLAEGNVYQGPLKLGQRVMTIVHGPAVNLSAKLAAAATRDVGLSLGAYKLLVDRLGDFGTPIDVVLGGRLIGKSLDLTDGAPRPVYRRTCETLVGRDAEFKLLTAAADLLERGEFGLVALSGAPGIGKTAVLENFLTAVQTPARKFWIRADPQRGSEYMFLWRNLLSALFKPQLGASSPPATDWLAAALSRGGVAEHLHGIVRDLVPDLSIPISHRLLGVEGATRRDLLERAIKAIFVALCERERVLICIDDAHWTDDASSALLEDIAKTRPAVLIVLTHREGSYVHLDRLFESAPADCVQRVVLESLSHGEIDEIVTHTNQVLARESGVREIIFNLCGGNPFHAEQIAHWLASRPATAVASGAGEWFTDPDFLSRVLDERLDGLSNAQTQIVRFLSVLDRSVSLEALKRALRANLDGSSIDAELDELKSRALVATDPAARRESEDVLMVFIKHRLIGEAAIARIPPTGTRALHARAARLLAEQRAASDPDVNYAQVAHHWRAAGENRRAAVCFGIAGDDVLYDGDPGLAVEFFGSAIALTAQGVVNAAPRTAAWQAGMAVAHWAQGAMHEARDDASRALETLDSRLGGPTWLPHAVRQTVARFRRIATVPLGIEEFVVQRPIRTPLVTLSAIRAEMAFFQGDIGTMISAYASLVGLANDPALRARVRARAYLFLGQLSSLFGSRRLAFAAWDSARQLGKNEGDNIAMCHGYLGEGLWHLSFGHWQAAEEQLHMAAGLFADVQDPVYYKFVETLLALSAYFQGDWRQCLGRFRALHEMGTKQHNRSTQAWGLYGQAEALVAAGEFSDADVFLAHAEKLITDMPDKQSEVICKGLRAQIEFGLGRWSDALTRATDCLAFARKLAANNFGSLEGFAAPAEVYLRLALDSRVTAPTRISAARNAKAALRLLSRFAAIHPIARPRLFLCRALNARLARRKTQAAKWVRAGLERAEALSMTRELLKLGNERSEQTAIWGRA